MATRAVFTEIRRFYEAGNILDAGRGGSPDDARVRLVRAAVRLLPTQQRRYERKGREIEDLSPSSSSQGHEGPQLTYTDEHLILEDPSRDIKRSWLAASGIPGTTPADQDIPNVGPVPEGKWQVDPTKIDEFHWYDPRDWDWWGPWGRSAWGNWRVPIDPVPESPATTRSGFFIHGGSRWGSAGCIDLCRGDESFFQVLRTYQDPIPLTVDY